MTNPEAIYFFLQLPDGDTSFPADWHRRLKSEGVMIIPERVFYRRRVVTVEITSEMTFDLTAAGIETQLPDKIRLCHYVRIGPNATYYWDEHTGFLEMIRGKDSDRNLSLAIQVYGLMLRRSRESDPDPIFIFLDDED
jgi:hypothetical protein